MEPNNSISVCLLLIRATGNLPEKYRRTPSKSTKRWYQSTLYLWRAIVAAVILYSIYLLLTK